MGIFGLTTEETPILVFPDNVEDLKFISALETAKRIVPKLRPEVDVLIALTHLGFYEESGLGYKAAGDLRLAREVSGIDVIVGGHSHTALKEPKAIGKTLIVQAGEWSKWVGRLDLTIDSDEGGIVQHRYRLIPVNMKTRIKYQGKKYFVYQDRGVVEDRDILQVINPYLKKADNALSAPVGEALVKLEGARDIVRFRETNLANLITDSMRAKTGADIAFQNAGGIRSDIAPGMITYRDILTVHPFGNTLVLMDMTGEQILDLLDRAAKIRPGQGAFLHASGIRWTNNKGKVTDVIVGKSPIDRNETFRVVTNNFLAAGGDGYTLLKKIPHLDSGFVDADSLRDYINRAGKVRPKIEGRLIIIK